MTTRYLTVKQAAKRVKRDVRTIERWISEDGLNTVRVGGIRFIAEEELLRSMRARLIDRKHWKTERVKKHLTKKYTTEEET